MKKIYALLVLLAMIIDVSYAQSSLAKDNIIITSQKTSYEYKLGDKNNPVVIKSNTVTNFQCTQYRATFPFSEIYDDMTTIEKVNIGAAGVKPNYSSYNSNGIFYSDAKICYFMIPFSKKGEEVEVEIQQICWNPRYFTTIYFSESAFVLEKEVEIIIPRWMNVELVEMNFTDNITKTTTFNAKRNTDTYIYKISKVPAMKSERNAPGPSYIYPHIMVLNKSAETSTGKQTYFATLNDQYAWYQGLVSEVKIDEPVLKTTAQELAKNNAADIQKIKTIFGWVQENIRYIAFEDGIAGFKPAAPQEVLAKKYGDCKGMAILTKELLKSLGLDARLAWLGTNHIAYNYSTPCLSVDNHVICALFYNDHIYYLDATEEYIGFDEYAQRIQGRQVLIENGEKYLLERIPERTAAQNTEMEKSNFQIKEGSLSGSVTQTYKGEAKESFLSSVHSIEKDKLNDALVEYLRKGHKQYEVSGLAYSSLEGLSELVSLEYHVDTKSGIQQYNNEYYIDLDFSKEFANMQIDTSKRKQDYWFNQKYHIIHEAELAIDANVVVESLPAGLHIARDGYRFDISYQQKEDKIIYKKEIAIDNPILLRSQFNQWNSDTEALKKAYLDQISLITK